MRSLKLILIVLLSGATLFACNQESYSPPAVTAEEAALKSTLAELLYSSRFQELEAKANTVQQAYERGKFTDINLLHIFRVFYDTNPRLELHYAQWVSMYPQSYAAKIGYGNYLRMRADEARGCNYIQETSQGQIAAMEALLGKAMDQYSRSVPLTAKPILSYHGILAIAMSRGDQETARAMLRSGCRIDSRNYIVRHTYLATLQTRWGGSLQQMVDFRNNAQRAGLTQQQIGYFDDMIKMERTWLAQNDKQ